MRLASTLTAAAYPDWEEQQLERHEFHRGVVSEMPRQDVNEATVIGNTLFALQPLLRPRGCRVYNQALRVRVEAADLFTYPDLSVVCGDGLFFDARRTSLLNPLVLVEVLSSSTESYDRGAKWSFYLQIPSLEAYVLISQDAPGVDVYSRDGDGWRVVHTAEGEARIPALDASLRLEALYGGVAFPGPEARTRPTPGV